MTALDPKRTNLVVGIAVVALVGAAGVVAYRTLHAQERGTRSAEDRPEDPTPASKPAPRGAPAIRLVLERVAATAGARGGVRIALDERSWTLQDELSGARADAVWAEVSAAIARRHAETPGASGEVVTRSAGDEALHASATRAVDAFLVAGVADVSFAGAEAGTPR